MSSFVNISYPTEHPAVARFESAVDAAGQFRRSFDSSKGLATMLLAALVAAMMVVADQLIESWADGHLLVVWVAFWAVAFAALALFAGTARRLAARVITGLDAWSSSVARGRADLRMWEAAKADPRMMADLQAAMARREADTEVATAPQVAAAVAVLPMLPVLPKRSIRLGGAELRAYQRNYI
jgi:hypothetical protein